MSIVLLRAVAFMDAPLSACEAVTAGVTAAGGEVLERRDGLIIAGFESASACVRACRALDDSVRAGVSCGDITQDEQSVQGIPVIEASRLKDKAARGQTLCAERMVRLCELDAGWFRPLGPLPLKGLGAPLAAVEILRAGS